MNKDLIQKVISNTWFVKYGINESFDKPFLNFTKVNNFEYLVYNGDIEGYFIFRRGHNDGVTLNSCCLIEKIDTYYDISWRWGDNVPDEVKTAANWVRMTASSFNIIDDFIRTVHPLVIKFGSHTGGNAKIYYNEHFIDKLRTIFGEHFDVFVDKEMDRTFLVNKEVSQRSLDNIEKRGRDYTNMSESWNYWKYPKKRNHRGGIKNDIIKEQIKRVLYKWKYL